MAWQCCNAYYDILKAEIIIIIVIIISEMFPKFFLNIKNIVILKSRDVTIKPTLGYFQIGISGVAGTKFHHILCKQTHCSS